MHLEVKDSDDEKILDSFDLAYDFIEKGASDGSTILVCCSNGISRSPTVLIAYFIKKYNLTFDEAYEKLKAIKDDIAPNDGFIIKLKAFDKKLKNKIEFHYKCS